VEFCRNPRPVAATASKRVIPTIRRTMGYLFWRLAGKLIR
jgi:hypothetical protein